MKSGHSILFSLATLPYPVLVGGADRRALSLLLGPDRPSVTIKRPNQHGWSADAWKRNFTAKGWDLGHSNSLSVLFCWRYHHQQIIERAEAESGGVEPSPEELWAAARECARPEFQGLALHVIPRYKWEDLILTEKIKQQLQDLVDVMAEQENVFHRWGASKVRARGYGIKALFSGGPGTRKTMAAEVIAGTIGLDMFRWTCLLLGVAGSVKPKNLRKSLMQQKAGPL